MRAVLEKFGQELTDPGENAAFQAALQRLEFSSTRPDAVTCGRELQELPAALRTRLQQRYMELFKPWEKERRAWA